MIHAGIDPGVRGAFALFDDDELVGLHDFAPNDVNGKDVVVDEVAHIVRWGGLTRVTLEEVWSRPGQNSASVFRFGRTVGVIEGVCHGLAVDYVTPQVWKRYYGIEADKSLSPAKNKAAQKKRALEIAVELWPHFEPQFARVKDADRAEAALIGKYGYDHLTGATT